MRKPIEDIVNDMILYSTNLKSRQRYYLTVLVNCYKGADKLAKDYYNDKVYYRERIDRAIKYIEEHKRRNEFLNLNEWQTRDLLNILKGED